ncbi:Hypothetical Protein SLY_0339 [Strawberry lethal yellows phytoplasma (CPA) str. NZSb11]|uniref:Uncharacterized protein n=1 Tax=Strawberry lethal yellows phytoplasma (CPA) str. NZSb11 TaxID=980422 RepID=R4S0C6_PHYAS|nr:Hypothetical Protein SLY_0339 [Strawberry lethal yellows phytoplasma (CPA) str. NZSb11]
MGKIFVPSVITTYDKKEQIEETVKNLKKNYF